MSDSAAELLLQVYVEVRDLSDALDEAKLLVALVAPHARIVACDVEPYWKNPAYYGVGLRLAADDCRAAFDSFMRGFAPAWEVGRSSDDPWAVWDQKTHGPSALASARWAHLQVFTVQVPLA